MALECHPPRPHPWKGRRRIGSSGTSDQPSLAPGWKIRETPGCGAQVLRPPPRDRKGPATPEVGVGGARAAPPPHPARGWQRGKGPAGVRGTRKAAAGWRPSGGVRAAQEPQQQQQSSQRRHSSIPRFLFGFELLPAGGSGAGRGAETATPPRSWRL
ncbi:hypothetical protein CapIbe_014382 [Capra ibex]